MRSTDARQDLRLLRAGLAGYPVSHSLSPRLFAAAARQCGIACSYELLPCDEEGFSGCLAACAEQGYHGINVTTPHKQRAFACADIHSEEARLTGNANLLQFTDEGILAANTDVGGFSRALTQVHGFDPSGKLAVILGTGSVARSVLLALSRLSCASVLVAGRSTESLHRFDEFAAKLRRPLNVELAYIDNEQMLELLTHADLLVNCTSAGMAGREDESPLGGFYDVPRGMLALDLVYHPAVTRFMAQLANCGAQSENGLAMLACQAAEAFELLSGHSVDAKLLLANVTGRP
ncbi:shikimate dehydrogenase [bacterium]|nr:shikimate dehydrogenase [bacterium]